MYNYHKYPKDQRVARCMSCGKRPEQLPEFIRRAIPLEITPTEYVELYEPTFNPVNGLFFCANCHMRQGYTQCMADYDSKLDNQFRGETNDGVKVYGDLIHSNGRTFIIGETGDPYPDNDGRLHLFALEFWEVVPETVKYVGQGLNENG